MASWWKRGAVALATASLLTGGMATLAASPAVADDGNGEVICWYDGKQYSPGAEVIMDGVRMVCTRTNQGTAEWKKAP